MTAHKNLKFEDLPIKFKLSDKLVKKAQLLNTPSIYEVTELDYVKKTVAVNFGKGGHLTLKLAELNRNIKNGDWVVIK